MSRNCSFAGALPLSVRLGSFGLRLFALRACSEDNSYRATIAFAVAKARCISLVVFTPLPFLMKKACCPHRPPLQAGSQKPAAACFVPESWCQVNNTKFCRSDIDLHGEGHACMLAVQSSRDAWPCLNMNHGVR